MLSQIRGPYRIFDKEGHSVITDLLNVPDFDMVTVAVLDSAW